MFKFLKNSLIAVSLTTLFTVSAFGMETTTAKVQKDHGEKEPNYILDLSDTEKAEAKNIAKLDNMSRHLCLKNAVDRYVKCAEEKDKQALSDDTIALQAFIAYNYLARSHRVSQYYPISKETHIKLMPKKFKSTADFDTYFHTKASAQVFSEKRLQDIPLIHTLFELRTLDEDVRPLAAYKMLIHAGSKYNEVLRSKRRQSLELLNALAEKSIDFYYAQELFLDLNDHRNNPYMLSQANIAGIDKYLQQHFEKDQLIRKNPITLDIFKSYIKFRAYQRFLKDQKELAAQLALHKQQQEESEKKQKEEKEKKRQDRKKTTQEIADKKKKDDDAEAKRKADGIANAPKLKQAKKDENRAARRARNAAAKAAASTKPPTSEDGTQTQVTQTSVEKETSDHSGLAVQMPMHKLEEDQKTMSPSQDASELLAAQTTAADTKQSELHAKEKIRKKAEKQNLRRLNRIKALADEDPDVDIDYFIEAVYTSFHLFKNNKFAPTKIAYDFFNTAKYPIRIAISRGYTAEQFIHNLKTAKDTHQGWDAYRILHKRLMRIPEYASLVGRSPEDMIRNLFRTAHSTPDKRLIN